MNINEMKDLEDKTRSILYTLEDLEKEIEEYQQRNADIISVMANLSTFPEQIEKAGKELDKAIRIFGDKDFSEAMGEIDKRIERLIQAETKFIVQTDIISDLLGKMRKDYEKVNEDISQINDKISELSRRQNEISDIKHLLKTISAELVGVDSVESITYNDMGKEEIYMVHESESESEW